MNNTLHFKTNTLLKNLVGKDLINDDNIAIIELVKNSYDANSKSVLIRFTNLEKNKTSNNSQIIVADEGTGMDLTDIEDKWLNIAYSDKKQVEQDEGFFLAGNKGIGRFSCDRLGEELDLLTRKSNDKLFHLHIKWSDFEKEGDKDLTIQQIDLEINIINDDKANNITHLSQFPKNGTILVISKLRSIWDYQRIRELKTDLEKFLNPNQLFLTDKFKIILSVPSFEKDDAKKDYSEKINVEIQNQIFQKLKFNATYIETILSKSENTIQTTLYHDGDKVFDLVEKNEYFEVLKGTKIVIYYLNPYKKAYFKKQTGVRSVDFGSIFLFLNGFRISPYGDRGNDWLGLDVRKSQGTQRYLGSRDIVGRIELQGSEEFFKPVSSREGLKKTPAFVLLKEKFFFEIFRKLEIFVVDGLNWDSVPVNVRNEVSQIDGLDWVDTYEKYSESWDRKKHRITLSIMTLIGSSPEKTIKFWFNPSLLDELYESKQENINKIFRDIEKFEPSKIDSSLSKQLVNLKKIIEKKEEEAKEAKNAAANLRIDLVEKENKINKLEKETETYRSQTLFLQQVSSLDTAQLITYHHQILMDSTIIDNFIGKAIKELRDLPKTKTIMDYLQKTSLANRRIKAMAQYATKANFRSGIKKELTDVPAYIEQYLLNVAKDFNASGLNLVVQNDIKELFEVNISRVELSILIDNIIMNSIKAKAFLFTVKIYKTKENTIRISFIDDGVGLSEEISDVESIFEMGITTTSGSGLGLYHAKQIVDKFDGYILANPLVPKGMEIIVEITR